MVADTPNWWPPTSRAETATYRIRAPTAMAVSKPFFAATLTVRNRDLSLPASTAQRLTTVPPFQAAKTTMPSLVSFTATPGGSAGRPVQGERKARYD